jgi:ARG/rhodanese/phosphatase superfamily protein
LTDPAPAAVPALRVGAPDVAGPLAVFPVFGPAPTLEFRSFAEAAALGASVVELPSGPSVNDLLVVNPLDVAVLLYEGEEVRGAQQDRTLDVSVLVAAGAELPVPVSCVEAGRWDAGRRTEPFAPAPQAAFPELRRAKSRSARATGRAQQHEVWAMVGEKAVRHGARSDTGALQDVFAARREAVDALSAPISRHDGQIGMVAVIGGDVAVADVVGRADVFAALHGPLLAGYALDAAECMAELAPPGPPPVAEVDRFLRAALASPTAPAPQIGLGRHARFAGPVAEGSLLTLDGELVALTAFRGERTRRRILAAPHG